MTARLFPQHRDPVQPRRVPPVTITVDGRRVDGLEGQTVAGVLLGSGRLAWRTTAAGRRPRGLFCGIGVCFDCLVTVNGVRDVRACQRLAREGDVVVSQDEVLPGAGGTR